MPKSRTIKDAKSRFLRYVEHLPEGPGVIKRVESTGDPTGVIVNRSLDPANPSKLCTGTVDMFVAILAAEAGNLAVKFLATGGVCLAGGVALDTLRAIRQPDFMQRFKRKGRFAKLMSQIPIHIVVAPAGLAGAAAYGLENSAADARLS